MKFYFWTVLLFIRYFLYIIPCRLVVRAAKPHSFNSFWHTSNLMWHLKGELDLAYWMVGKGGVWTGPLPDHFKKPCMKWFFGLDPIRFNYFRGECLRGGLVSSTPVTDDSEGDTEDLASEYRVGRLARGISGGCSHDGIYRLEERVEKGREPGFMKGANTPVWICRKQGVDPTNQCERSAPTGVIRYLCESELELMEDWKPGDMVRVEGGIKGRLFKPMGCFCGPNGEECWYIDLNEKRTLGISTHGIVFSRTSGKLPDIDWQ